MWDTAQSLRNMRQLTFQVLPTSEAWGRWNPPRALIHLCKATGNTQTKPAPPSLLSHSRPCVHGTQPARIAPPQVQGLVFLFHGDQTKPTIRLKIWKMDAERGGGRGGGGPFLLLEAPTSRLSNAFSLPSSLLLALSLSLMGKGWLSHCYLPPHFILTLFCFLILVP